MQQSKEYQFPAFYRDYKGNIFYATGVHYDISREENVVIFHDTFEHNNLCESYVSFTDVIPLDDISVFGQAKKYVLLKLGVFDLSSIETKQLLNELKKREDNPYKNVEPEEVLEEVYVVGYKTIYQDPDTNTYKEYIEVSNVFENAQRAFEEYLKLQVTRSTAFFARRSVVELNPDNFDLK